jgi:hypothetical protein
LDRGGYLVALNCLAAQQRQDQERQGAFEKFRIHRFGGVSQGFRYIGFLCITARIAALSSVLPPNTEIHGRSV